MTETPITELADASAGPDQPPGGPVPPAMISVEQLSAHPGNVREDLDLAQEFLASVAEMGVRLPLLVTPDGEGGYRVIEGHRRLAAAVKLGITEVPCVLDPGRADDQAGQFLDMVIANGGGYRRNLTVAQEALALFSAHEAGASRTRIRKATGRKAEEVKAALQAGGISAETRAQMGVTAGQLTLDQLALLAEFDGDQEAVGQLLEALRRGYAVDYVAERIRRERADAAAHERLCAEFEVAGTPVTDTAPDGAVRLTLLTQDGEDLTAEAHASCPGRGVYFLPWSLLEPVHYCTSPVEYGHAVRGPLIPAAPDGGGDGGSDPAPVPDPPARPEPDIDPDRRLVIEGNKAWRAASEVRRRWLTSVLFARRTAPREAGVFVARQLLTMADPVRSGLATAPGRGLFATLTGRNVTDWLQVCDATPAGRLPLLMLGPIVTAFEQAMTEGEGVSTWRTDRYSPCPRGEAGGYLVFLAGVGYQLSVIEQAVADGVPYSGDTPDGPDLTDPPAAASDDSPVEASAATEDSDDSQAPPEAA